MDSSTAWKLVGGIVLVAWLSKGAFGGFLGATLVPYILQFFGILYIFDMSTKGWKIPEVQLPVPSVLWLSPTPTPTAVPLDTTPPLMPLMQPTPPPMQR